MKKAFSNLTVQVLTAIALGVAVGALFPAFGAALKPIADTFISLIKMLITPIIFLTVVLGIAGMGSMKKVGRVGGKALLYFEVVTTLALAIGIIVANLTQPGAGVQDTAQAVMQDSKKAEEAAKFTSQAGEMNWVEFFTHIVPDNVVGAFAKGDILQVLLFSVLFGLALNRMGETAQPLVKTFDRLSHAMFGVLAMVMKLAPLGAFGGMAFTIGKYGIATLLPLGKLMLVVYATMFLFVFVILNLILRYYKLRLGPYLRFIKEEILLVLGTSSSESALPRMIDKMERYGCSRSVAGLVIPTGYSFNLDGTSIYLSIAVIFLAQAFNIPLSLTQQLSLIAILIVTSKGAAGVTGSGFIVLASTLAATNVIPVESVALLLGVDRFMSEARAITNVIGNGVATLVIAKSEGEFDENRHQLALAGKSVPEELAPEPVSMLPRVEAPDHSRQEVQMVAVEP
ncbi:dicarboxylate/amino acid:cation symporter [Hymenobacter sp. BT186]|uniref:Dicarboxylate/amino acid:cation symporter n=1 Tax=Hymenobacter telluris TaxID=2816474 RepID=A0A939F1F9_9BACT|nr:dicarboxylate/amino acid:cation symporter [Hymenobacter telluris]MBO0360991.1 dicarboxylate/amino acid:cation symporter [Hymenobacter telluris]MBW3377019.1 dicarboxylate/amino acid:cation symporter [Hymenobacter norwichensis]